MTKSQIKQQVAERNVLVNKYEADLKFNMENNLLTDKKLYYRGQNPSY